MANINPTPEEVKPNVAPMRIEFKKKYASQIASGTYDKRDLDRLENDDAYARGFLRTLKSKNDVSKAVDVINECFLFRKQIGIWDLTEESFPAEIRDKNGLYYKGVDKQGFKLLFVDVAANTAKDDNEKQLMRNYIAFKLEEHHRTNPETMVTVLFDMHKATTMSFNKETSNYFITCFAIYFPAFISYMMNYEMPMLLGAIWKIISSFMSAEQNAKVKAVSKSKIKDYLPEDNLWDFMK